MSRKPGSPMEKIFIGHWRWLQEQGKSHKLQAASFKQQAASVKLDSSWTGWYRKVKEK